VAFEILEDKECNIFAQLPKEQFRKLREGMIRSVNVQDSLSTHRMMISLSLPVVSALK
jgi:hypothetical protein